MIGFVSAASKAAPKNAGLKCHPNLRKEIVTIYGVTFYM
jgi:hypothetical protein